MWLFPLSYWNISSPRAGLLSHSSLSSIQSHDHKVCLVHLGDRITSCVRELVSLRGGSFSENVSCTPDLSSRTSARGGAEKKLGSVMASLKIDQTAAAEISATWILLVIPLYSYLID